MGATFSYQHVSVCHYMGQFSNCLQKIGPQSHGKVRKFANLSQELVIIAPQSDPLEGSHSKTQNNQCQYFYEGRTHSFGSEDRVLQA